MDYSTWVGRTQTRHDSISPEPGYPNCRNVERTCSFGWGAIAAALALGVFPRSCGRGVDR